MVDRQGRYSIDQNGGQFSPDLADAHVFSGYVRTFEGVRMQEVILTINRLTEVSAS